jgi:HPt (histidine-containing phosphotransfer) domain-containing protein
MECYLPDIDIEDGKSRVMGNMNLYTRLLGKFNGTKMAEDIAAAVKAGDTKGAAQAAHALRGTAANLGFPLVRKITEEIETRSKKEEDCNEFLPEMEAVTASLSDAIARFLAAQS